jgi:hypothetical protein
MLGRVASWGDRNPHGPSRSFAKLGVNDAASGSHPSSVLMRPAEQPKTASTREYEQRLLPYRVRARPSGTKAMWAGLGV